MPKIIKINVENVGKIVEKLIKSLNGLACQLTRCPLPVARSSPGQTQSALITQAGGLGREGLRRGEPYKRLVAQSRKALISRIAHCGVANGLGTLIARDLQGVALGGNCNRGTAVLRLQAQRKPGERGTRI